MGAARRGSQGLGAATSGSGQGVCAGGCFCFIILVCVREGLFAVYPVSLCVEGFFGVFPFYNYVRLSKEGITLEGAKWTTSFGLPLLWVSCFGVFPPPRTLLSKALATAGVPPLSLLVHFFLYDMCCAKVSDLERFRLIAIQLNSTSTRDQ